MGGNGVGARNELGLKHTGKTTRGENDQGRNVLEAKRPVTLQTMTIFPTDDVRNQRNTTSVAI